jgi:hypothetical protein
MLPAKNTNTKVTFIGKQFVSVGELKADIYRICLQFNCRM